MLVTMKRPVFDSLDYAALGLACVEPTILQVRGKNPAVKRQAYLQLNTGQRAVFMFWVLYGHVGNSIDEFYCWVCHLQSQPETWSELKAGLRYFDDEAMLHLLEETESLLGARNRHGDGMRRDVCARDLVDDRELLTSADRLNAVFRKLVPTSLKIIGAYIRNNPAEFVCIED